MKTGRPNHWMAFTLVEIMVVVLIIGLLAALGMFSYTRARESAQNNAFIGNIRVFQQAFILYALDHKGQYPADVTPAVVPAGMDQYFKPSLWTSITPVGGKWDWDNGQFGIKAGVSVYQPTAKVNQMKEIDRILDDGDLATGNLRRRSSGYIYIIEP